MTTLPRILSTGASGKVGGATVYALLEPHADARPDPGPGSEGETHMSAWKKVALAVVATAAVIIGLVVATFVATFGSDAAIIEGEIAPGVHVVRDGFATSYIVNVTGGVALVDAAEDRSGAAIKAALKAKGDPAVLALFITHGHFDHIGACSLFPKSRIIAHADEVPLIHGEVAARGPMSQFLGKSDGACRVTEPVADDQVVSPSMPTICLVTQMATQFGWLDEPCFSETQRA